MKKRIVVLSGAGISAESGISTFRDSDGLWEKHDVMEVASAAGFARNPELVHRFYNQRRAQLLEVEPNSAHIGLAELEKDFEVNIVTQNVDNLHERAGSTNVLHLHGELMKVRSVTDESKVFTLTADNIETTPDTEIEGHKVRPHIVFFDEAVPNIHRAVELMRQADICVIVGTSLQVQPAASLYRFLPRNAPIYYIDLRPVVPYDRDVDLLTMTATEGVKQLTEILQNMK
ncbi:MAG: NAD-dependent deacylase [Muribaculaceae bacterium]|nr:NAD-dependent deacylase [Muribaculaceae bacterium]